MSVVSSAVKLATTLRLAHPVARCFNLPQTLTCNITRPNSRYFCTGVEGTSDVRQDITLTFQRGLPLLTVLLPSRREPCQFSLRPLSDNVGTFCEYLRNEDKGIDYVALYTKDDVRISSSTSIEHLLQFGDFTLRINDKYFYVNVPKTAASLEMETSSERLRELDDIKATIASLHASLNVDEYKLKREQVLVKRLEKAELELKPLQEHKTRIERECERHTERVMWSGFAAMGIQTGLFARLTWWEYSWDIMEPITYFATFSTGVVSFGYYLYTRQVFEYPLARDRVFTKQFYKRALNQSFDIKRYNELVSEVEEVSGQLCRLRDPLFQHLPVSYLSRLDNISNL